MEQTHCFSIFSRRIWRYFPVQSPALRQALPTARRMLAMEENIGQRMDKPGGNGVVRVSLSPSGVFAALQP